MREVESSAMLRQIRRSLGAPLSPFWLVLAGVASVARPARRAGAVLRESGRRKDEQGEGGGKRFHEYRLHFGMCVGLVTLTRNAFQVIVLALNPPARGWADRRPVCCRR